MNKFLAFATGLLLLAGLARADELPTVDLGGAPATAAEDPSALFTWLDGLQSLQAAFVQTAANGRQTHGTMYLRRPGQLRFEYEPSVPILIVSDGDVLRFIDYEVGQVTPLPIEETPLALLIEPVARLKSHIEIVDSGPGAEAGSLMVTAQDRDHPEYGSLTLRFDQAEGTGIILRGWTVTDGQGLVTRIDLSTVKTNLPLADALFRFEDPRKGPVSRRRRAG